MSLFPMYRYRFFGDPFNRFFNDQLDFFDPWYDFHMFPSLSPIIPRFRWINEPLRSTYSSINTVKSTRSIEPAPRESNSEIFSAQRNVAGFNPETVKPRVEGRKAIIEAKQEDRQERDYSLREMRKTYELPANADINQLTSYVTPDSTLVIEVPIRKPETARRLTQTTNNNQSLTQFGQHRDSLSEHIGFSGGSDFQPRIVDKDNNQKRLEVNVGMKNYRPEEIKVSVKNNELIVQGEHQYKDNNRSERSSFFKSTTLPPGTQVEQLESYLSDDGQLKIEGPFVQRNRH